MPTADIITITLSIIIILIFFIIIIIIVIIMGLKLGFNWQNGRNFIQTWFVVEISNTCKDQK